MSYEVDQTHDAGLKSWIESANEPGCDFPIQNLPFGVFRLAGTDEPPRIGVAIGDSILDLAGCVSQRLLDDIGPEGCCALTEPSLNKFMALGPGVWRGARGCISRLLAEDNPRLRTEVGLRERYFVPQSEAEMLLPVHIGDYTDFYASVHHATNVGSMFRPDNPLMPNYKHLPVGYHGRASSIVVSGTPVRRPMGQTKTDDAEAPSFGPCRLLDYELEMGFFTGRGNSMGERIAMPHADEHIFGMCILNDWSARDIQKWEYQPLGPFNAKNFASAVSPWVVTMEALAPFRVPGPPRGEGDPPVLEYLQPVEEFGLDITCEVFVASETMRQQGMEPMRLSRGNFKEMYWTIAQMLVHHTSTGCNMQPGDLLGSGTVSGPAEDARGCMLELTWRGEHPIQLPDGAERRFLQDGDEVIIKASCERGGYAGIGFGECRGIVLPARTC